MFSIVIVLEICQLQLAKDKICRDDYFMSLPCTVTVSEASYSSSFLLSPFIQALRDLSNFNSYLAILSAIESAPVSRLDWSERVIKVFKLCCMEGKQGDIKLKVHVGY